MVIVMVSGIQGFPQLIDLHRSDTVTVVSPSRRQYQTSCSKYFQNTCSSHLHVGLGLSLFTADNNSGRGIYNILGGKLSLLQH